MAATVGIDSDFPFVKVVSAETMAGLSESSKCAVIVKVFEDAYKSALSIIILDDIERLLELIVIGPRFSNFVCQTLLVLLKKIPPQGRNLLVIGTTSEVDALESLRVRKAFDVTYHVPTLRRKDIRKVLQQLSMFSEDDLDAAVDATDEIPINTLFFLIKMAAQSKAGKSAEAIYSGKEKINIHHFFDRLGDLAGSDNLY